MKTNKTGRKAITVAEITDRNFTIVDLSNLNSNVKTATLRMHVKRNLASGRYIVAGSNKTGKRGKPSTVYAYTTTTTNAVTA